MSRLFTKNFGQSGTPVPTGYKNIFLKSLFTVETRTVGDAGPYGSLEVFMTR